MAPSLFGKYTNNVFRFGFLIWKQEEEWIAVNKGKKRSEETKKKMSDAHKGKWVPGYVGIPFLIAIT
ncbi:MAG: NUMOD3 domain-containing DNA-binding protein [Candidatus Nitrosopolaris sp.]